MSNRRGSHSSGAIAFLIVSSVLLIGCACGQAQEAGTVQVLTGYLAPEQGLFYDLPDLQEGQTLYVYAEGTGGNLDPFIALSDPNLTPFQARNAFVAEVNRSIAEGRDPLLALPEVADRFFLAWDDDSGEGYAAALEYRIPESGDYRLVIASTPTRETFGEYRLLVGLDAPQVLTGEAEQGGAPIAVLNTTLTPPRLAITEASGSLTEIRTSTFYTLYPVEGGDTFYASIEATSGNLIPVMVLRDFGGKPLSAGIPEGGSRSAALQYTFEDASSNNRLEIFGRSVNGTNTTGDYRLLAGLNAPEVLTGSANETALPLLQQPIEVKVGVELDQITTVDQQAEHFGVVANIWMEWTDPNLAFSPDACHCNFKLYRSIESFVAAEGERWPEFTLFNQQERRWTQNQLILVEPDGTATYFERFWVILQAPDFNFRQYPFDEQDFFIRIDSLYPEGFYVFAPWPEKTAIGGQLGEEEWYITSSDANVTSIQLTNINSRYSFHFKMARHLTFYILRILVPILIIILLTYVTFLLKDYGKRADVAAANLLLFIAFNFTIAGDLPRLGYLTFLDTILITTFVITALTVGYNLYLRWLATEKEKEIAERIDRAAIWGYPLAYITVIAVIALAFYL
ncbi:MAG: hypothetical protein QMD46_09505 [Methanomicrobiales archaeon]|nr:hypothetical protein [Methanomicrobiales archaeon]MDI6877244.1 hypothetical protein [Methanomicrobiales archaeon]